MTDLELIRQLDRLYVIATRINTKAAWTAYHTFRAQVAPLFTDERSEA